jgi:mannan endo-1,4-beta-mannosidase
MGRKVYSCVVAFLMMAVFLNAADSFVRVKDGKLIRNGKPYRFIGMNYWYGSLLGMKNGDRARLARELDFLQKQGITNLRAMVGVEGISRNDSHLKFPLQPKQSEYDDAVLDGLDYFLAEACKRHMTVVLFLSNNWEWTGGFAQYLEWNGKGTYPYPTEAGWSNFISFVGKFYNCNECKDAFNRHCKFILGRTNRYTHKPYAEDPTIMAWELANEPRPDGTQNKEVYKQWIGEISHYIKTLDKNHLLTTGTEGEKGTEEDIELWKDIHSFPDVDYTTIHIWAKNWSWINFADFDRTFAVTRENMKKYVRDHALMAEKLKKPMVIEEIGFPRDRHLFTPESTTVHRDLYFADLFNMMDGNLKSFQGINIWAFGGEGRAADSTYKWKKGDPFLGDPPQEEQGLNSVFDTDYTTLKLIRQYNLKFKKTTR